MRGLFYCQHLIGMGHLVRSLNICKSLVEVFDIDFLQGGVGNGPEVKSPRFNHIILPQLWRADWNSNAADPSGKISVEAIFDQRMDMLNSVLSKTYDFVITEYFPFSKFEFKEEIFEILRKVKVINPSCKIICSLRDVVDKWSEPENLEATKNFMQFYDYVLVHGDQKLIILEDSFPQAKNFSNKIIYTGYIADNKAIKLKRMANTIIISMGTGSYGDELVLAAAKSAVYLKDYQFHFFLGPKTKQSIRSELDYLRKISSEGQIIISEFTPTFMQELAQCSLSINLAGYNTMLELFQTQTPAIVYPYPNQEQKIRAEKFASKGFIRKVSKEELEPKHLSQIILEHLNVPYPTTTINIDGAENTKNILLRILS